MSFDSLSRFERTLEALQDCYEHLFDCNVGTFEHTARKKLVELCRIIALETSKSCVDGLK